MVSYLPIRDERLNKIHEATRLDETIKDLTDVIVNGGPVCYHILALEMNLLYGTRWTHF